MMSRARFNKWLRSIEPSANLEADENDPAIYEDFDTQRAWLSWQAALRLVPDAVVAWDFDPDVIVGGASMKPHDDKRHAALRLAHQVGRGFDHAQSVLLAEAYCELWDELAAERADHEHSVQAAARAVKAASVPSHVECTAPTAAHHAARGLTTEMIAAHYPAVRHQEDECELCHAIFGLAEEALVPPVSAASTTPRSGETPQMDAQLVVLKDERDPDVIFAMFETVGKRLERELASEQRFAAIRLEFAKQSEAEIMDLRKKLSAASAIERRLEKPAMVGNTRFGIGIKWETVIGRAEREYEYMVTPEKEAERLERVRNFVAAIEPGHLCTACGADRFTAGCQHPQGPTACIQNNGADGGKVS